MKYLTARAQLAGFGSVTAVPLEFPRLAHGVLLLPPRHVRLGRSETSTRESDCTTAVCSTSLSSRPGEEMKEPANSETQDYLVESISSETARPSPQFHRSPSTTSAEKSVEQVPAYRRDSEAHTSPIICMHPREPMAPTSSHNERSNQG
jgi:hypothetical protein